MLRSHFEFACVLHIISVSLVSSVSFGDFCSANLSCHSPLICSNSNECICPSTSSFWNSNQNTCLSCPSKWIEWNNEKCLFFISPPDGGTKYQNARNVCLTQSAQLLQIKNYEDLVQFEYKIEELMKSEHGETLVKFLNDGVWINPTNYSLISYEWCDADYANDALSSDKCVGLMKRYSEHDHVTSFCLRPINCNEKLPFICERLAEISLGIKNVTYTSRGFAAAITAGLNLVGNLFGSNNQQQPEPQQPIIHVVTVPSEPQAQTGSKTSTTAIILYVVLGIVVVVIIIVILLCFCGGGLFVLHKSTKAAAPTTVVLDPRVSMARSSHLIRNSTDTTGSNISYISR